jgi:hypothetical protein
MTRSALVYAVAITLVPAAVKADPSINFMGDVDYEIEHDPENSNTFRAPTLDIFATQTEGAFTFVGELVVEAFGSNDFTIDADRLEVSYKPWSWLRFRVGRMRTAFGYYGDAYQNGKFFLIPLAAPLMYDGGDIDGIVPSHCVGLHVDAVRALPGGAGKLSLDAELLNGRGLSLDEVPSLQDENNAKAVNLRLRYLGQDALDGLIVGANLYLDTIPVAPGESTARSSLQERIAAAHLVYVGHQVHVVSELAYFHHRDAASAATYRTFAMFAEAGYAFGDLVPYARYDHARYRSQDPYFTASGVPASPVDLLSLGAKYVASASVAFKLELSLDVVSLDRRAAAQAAFAF